METAAGHEFSIRCLYQGKRHDTPYTYTTDDYMAVLQVAARPGSSWQLQPRTTAKHCLNILQSLAQPWTKTQQHTYLGKSIAGYTSQQHDNLSRKSQGASGRCRSAWPVRSSISQETNGTMCYLIWSAFRAANGVADATAGNVHTSCASGHV